MPVASRVRNATRATPSTDGRQRRSERSREAIVQALLELVGDGILQPTAQQVAATFELGSERPAGGGCMAVCSWGGPAKSSWTA